MKKNDNYKQNGLKPMYSLERHFEQACSRHPHLQLLESQWRFDKELISKALQNIGTMFPHYSRHDASHSKQIVVNIERMLGEKIKHLTATDTWLLLEAAYNHDIGMVVTQRQIGDMNDPEFEEFIKDISKDKQDPLCSFAENWRDGQANLPKGAAAHEFFQKYNQLLAEWFRRKHPENSAKVVRNPSIEIGLNSPRNELLPNRLFRVLADICEAHGTDFQGVLELPFSESGMATEDCHPRYVACLLRMGDLLDLDDNRFCPVMLQLCGSNLPKTSQAHLDKHHSIRHFRLDSEFIEITSSCPNPAAYEVAFDWFQWLEQEYRDQTQNWKEIVPSRKLGQLPILTKTIVNMEKPYLILEQGKKPDFKVDSAAMLELVRGTGLYPSKFDSIREILQNAVDASLIAAWTNHADEIKGLNPTSPKLQEILKAYEIIVDLEEDPSDSNFWVLRVIDKGTGISFDTLKYMLSVGGSAHNKHKRNIIDEMPKWYRPSGSFGLGLQSTYLISDDFVMTTRSRDTGKALEINFSKKGSGESVVIKEIDDKKSKSMKCGNALIVRIKIDDFPEVIHFEEGLTSDYLKNYDFTKESNLSSYEPLRIQMKIHEFSEGSPIPINYIDRFNSIDKTQYFCRENNILLSNICFNNHGNNIILTYFRGQVFKGFNGGFDFLTASIDFYGYDAKSFLTYSREKILPEVLPKVNKNTIETILSYIDRNFNNLEKDQQPNAAAFHYMYNLNHVNKYESELSNFKVYFCDGHFKVVQDLIYELEANTIKNIYTIKSGAKITAENPLSFKTLRNSFDSSVICLLINLMADRKWFYREDRSDSTLIEYTFNKNDIQPISDIDLAEYVKKDLNFHSIGNRRMFPCWGKYRALAIKINAPYVKTYYSPINHDDQLILPCFFCNDEQGLQIDTSSELSKWTFSHRKNEKVTLERIEELYQELRDHLVNICDEGKELGIDVTYKFYRYPNSQIRLCKINKTQL